MSNQASIRPRAVVNQLRAFTPDLPDRTVPELCRMLGRDDVIKLSFNESPYGSSPNVAAAIAKAAMNIHCYHDPEGKALRNALANLYEVNSDHIFLANGADEAITLIAQAFLSPGEEAIIPAPTFGACSFSTRLVGAEPVMVPVKADYGIDLEAMAAAVSDKTKLVYLCNPNNPTSMILSSNELRQFIARLPKTAVIVIDEAYAEYVTDPDFLSGLELLDDYPNIIVVRTFSKIYGMAALRLGYGIASPEVVSMINRVRNPFNVNYIAHAAALAALADDDFRIAVSSRNADERQRLTTFFTELGWRVNPSQTNFLLVDTGCDSAALCSALTTEGIIIRPAHGWHLPHHIRITIGSPEQNDRLIDAIKTFVGSK